MYCYYDNIVSIALDVAMVMEWRAEILEWSTIVTLANLRSLGFFWSSFLTINQLCFISTYYQLSLQTCKDVISL